jgi:hypothetical protein
MNFLNRTIGDKTLNALAGKNRLIYFFSILLLIMAVGLLISYFYINSKNFRMNVKSIITTQLEGMLEKRIEIGSVDTISFQSIQLTHLVIFENNQDKANILFQTEKLEARYSLFFPFFKWKGWQLNIKEITFFNAYIELTREITGEFDLVKKLNLDSEYLQENIIIQQINFQNSYLVYQDELVFHYDQDALITKAKDVQGYFDLTHLPKVEFDFEGIQDSDRAFLSLSGLFFINKKEYSLDFNLQNADITHFQYYFEAAEEFNTTQGKFDLVINLSFSPEWETNESFWQGKATFSQASAKPIFLNQIPFQQINGDVVFTKPEITISGLSGLYHDSVVQLEGEILTEPEIYFDLNIEGEQVNASLLRDDVSLFVGECNDFALQGEVNLSGNINGLLDDFYINGAVNASEIIIEKIPFPNISGNFSLNSERLIINTLESRDSNSSISIDGHLDWSDEIPSYQFAIKTLNLSLRHSLFQQFPFLAEFSGNIDSSLQMDSQRQDNSVSNLTGDFKINNMRMGDFSLPDSLEGSIKSTMNLSDKLLSIEQCELESSESNGSLKGELRFEELINFILDFEYQIPDLAIYSNFFEPEAKIAGSITFHGQGKGSIQQPEIDIELQLSEVSIQNTQVGEITGKLTYQKDVLSVESFSLTNRELQLSGEGKIITTKTDKPEIILSYQLHPLVIKPLLERVDYTIPLSGQTKGSGYIQGTWPELKISGNLQLEQIAYQDYQLGEGEVDFYLQPEQIAPSESQEENSDSFFSGISNNYALTLENLELQNEMIQLNAKGQATMGEKHTFTLEIGFLHQAFNEMIEHFYPAEENIKRFLPSRITGEAAYTGNNDKQQILLSCLLIPQQQESNPPSRLEAMLTVDKDGLNISNFQLTQSEGLLKAEGKIASNGSLDIDFQTTQLDISTVISLVQIEEQIKGIMDIKGLCTGSLEQPNISITAQIKQGSFREFNFQNLQSELRWDSLTNLLEIKELTIALEKEYQITARGTIPVESLTYTKGGELDLPPSYPDIPLDFQINMEKADLNVLKVFWQDTFSEITGTTDLELSLTGTAYHPIVNGTINIYQGIIHLTELPVQIGEINNTVKIINNKVVIPSLPVIAYKNQFNLSGELELVRFFPDNISFIIKNENEKITYQDILESEVDLELIISNSILSPHISGQVFLTKGILRVKDLLQIEEGMDFAFGSSAPGYNSLEQLEVDIELIDPFKLQMNDAEIDIGGKISLNGSLADPTLQGTLTLKKGSFMYFDKRFSILDGLVTINGINPADIDLNARAYTTVQGVQININVIGNLSNPQVLLSSQPALKETEILSLLTFNRNIQGLSEGEINQLLSQEMVNILFQSLQINLFRRMERELAEDLGLEFIRISFNSEENADSHFFLEDLHLADLTLEVGKNIGDDLFITYSTPLDFHGETSLSLDYQVSSDFTFSTQLETYSLKQEDYKIKFGLEIRF